MKGKVKFFNRTKGFGFIAGEDNKEVIFDVEEGDRGPKAVNVKKQD